MKRPNTWEVSQSISIRFHRPLILFAYFLSLSYSLISFSSIIPHMCVETVVGYKYLSSCRHRQNATDDHLALFVDTCAWVTHDHWIVESNESENLLSISLICTYVHAIYSQRIHWICMCFPLSLSLAHLLLFPIRLSGKFSFSFIFNFPLSRSQSFSQCALTICKHVMQCKYISPSQSSLFTIYLRQLF